MQANNFTTAILAILAPVCLGAGRAEATSEAVLYSFTNGADGENPVATLLNIGGISTAPRPTAPPSQALSLASPLPAR